MLSEWPMHGGGAGRTSLKASVRTRLREGDPSPMALEDYGLGQHQGDVAHPVLYRDDLLLPNLNEEGFSLFSPAVKRTLWTCRLWARPDASATPVQFGANAYAALRSDDAVVFVAIRLDTGEPRFLHMAASDLSPQQSPLYVGKPDGGAAIAWPLRHGLALMRFDEEGKLMHSDGRRVTVIPCRGLAADEYVLSPIGLQDRIATVTTSGKVFEIPWTTSLRELEFRGAKKVAALDGAWRCGPPVVAPDVGVVFLAAQLEDASGRGRGEAARLFLAMNAFHGHVDTIPLERSEGADSPDEAEMVPMVDFLDRERPLVAPGNLFVPSLQPGLYRVILASEGEAKVEWKKAFGPLRMSRFTGTRDFLVVFRQGEASGYELSNLYSKTGVEGRPFPLRDAHNNPRIPVADPVLSRKALYVLSEDCLFELPLVRTGERD